MSQLSQLRSPAAVQAALDEFLQLGRTKFLARYGYGKSRDFLVRDPKSGADCDSKAIAGVAYGKQFPDQGPLSADSFSGGEATVVPALTRLGFSIIRIGEDWSEDEVAATVTDYFEMLRAEAAGLPFNKSEHNQALRRQLNGRSKSSVELKHQNISAVLDALGLPYINGYKPRGNTQLLLRKSVQAYVLKHQQAVGAIVDALEEVKLPSEKTHLAALVEAPKREVLSRAAPRCETGCRESSTLPRGTRPTRAGAGRGAVGDRVRATAPHRNGPSRALPTIGLGVGHAG